MYVKLWMGWSHCAPEAGAAVGAFAGGEATRAAAIAGAGAGTAGRLEVATRFLSATPGQLACTI